MPATFFPIVLARVIHISDTGPDRVEGFERANERAHREHLNANATIARGGDPLRQTLRAGLKPRRPRGPLGHHLQLSESLSDGRRGEGRPLGKGSRPSKTISTLHNCLQSIPAEVRRAAITIRSPAKVYRPRGTALPSSMMTSRRRIGRTPTIGEYGLSRPAKSL